MTALATAQEATEVVELSPFEVSTTGDVGYYAGNAVSATKFNIPMQNLPMNVQVLTREFLEDTKAVSLEDAVNYSATINTATTEPGRFSLRGFINPTPMRNGLDTLAESNFIGVGSVERIEIVKGPAAILYGITEPGGLINIITKKPQFESSGSLTVQAGAYSTFRGEFDTTGPVGEGSNLAYRLVGVYNDVGYDAWFAEDKTKQIAPSLKWLISDKTSLLLAVEYQEFDSVPRGTRVIKVGTEADGDLQGARVGWIAGRFYGLPRQFNGSGPDAFINTETTFASADFQHLFLDDRMAFRAVLNYTENSIESDLRLGDGIERVGPDGQLGWVNYTFLGRNVDREELSLQTELTGTIEAGLMTHRFLVGYEYTDFEQDQKAFRQNNVIRNFDLRDPSTWDFRITIPKADRTITPADFVRLQDTWSSYAMHQGEMVDGRLHTLLGLRYDVVNGSTLNRRPSPPSDTPVPEAKNWTPQGGLLFDVTDQFALFASYSESFSPNLNVNPDGSTFDPATGEGLDIGFKFNSHDHRYNATVSFFKIDKTNIVRRDVERTENDPNSGLWFNTSGLERSEGVELDLVVTPFDNYQVTLSFAYIDARIVSNTDNPATEGNPLRDTPRRNFALWNKYTFDQGPLDGFFVGAGVIARSESTLNEVPVNQTFSYPAYTLIDLLVGYNFRAGGLDWEVSAKLNNVKDDLYQDRQTAVANGRNLQFFAKVRF